MDTKMNASSALTPVWFRFTDPEDKAAYGDEWYLYDESTFMRLPARELITLETELGMPLVSVMNGFRSNSALGDAAIAWMAVRAVNSKLAGDFDEFNPLVMTIEWTIDNPIPVGKDESPALMPEPPESDSLTLSTSLSMTSGPMDTVVLPTMPIAGSRT